MFFLYPVVKQMLNPHQDHLPKDAVDWVGLGASLSLINALTLRLVVLDYLHLADQFPKCANLGSAGLTDEIPMLMMETFILTAAVAGYIETQRQLGIGPTPMCGLLIPIMLLTHSILFICEAAHDLPLVACVNEHQPRW